MYWKATLAKIIIIIIIINDKNSLMEGCCERVYWKGYHVKPSQPLNIRADLYRLI